MKSADIELRVISNNEILTQVAQFNDLQSFYFENHIITRDWFENYNQLSFDSLGMRYNPKFNVETWNGIEKLLSFYSKIKSY